MKKEKLIALVKGKNRKESILKALALIGKDLDSFLEAKTVLIKPNFTSAYNPTASTQGETVEAVLEFFQEFDPNFGKKRIVIAESGREALARFGFEKIFAKYPNVKFWDLNKAKSLVSIPIETLGGKTKVRIPKKIFHFDYKISVSIPKTHDTVIFTGGVKNFLMGAIKQEDKGLMHGLVGLKPALALPRMPWRFLLLANIYGPNWLKNRIYGFNKEKFVASVACLHKNLATIGKIIMPDLVVLDGWWGMEGDGPVYGRRRNLGVAIASADPVKADAVGAKVIGFEPEKIGYLRLLAKAGKGELSLKNLVGEKITSVAQRFLPHRHFKYQSKA